MRKFHRRRLGTGRCVDTPPATASRVCFTPPNTPSPLRRMSDAYSLARQRYADVGVDTDAALDRLRSIAVSLHCWQGDDVGGFEGGGDELGGGLAVTGNYPGRASTPDELRSDLETAFSMIPGRHRVNLHACYGEFDGEVKRDAIDAAAFRGWIDWAGGHGLSLDFNPTFFGHPLAADGLTLSHPDESVRKFWIDHGIACRHIAAEMGRAQGNACITNFWVPDGYKDTPADRAAPRQRLADSLDAIFADAVDPKHNLDAVECKLFGIGSESYVVGSHEFYLGYAITRGKLLCLDAGHFHPTEVISDKISSVLQYLPEILLHVSRGVRWDSDHVVTDTDELNAIASEIVGGGFEDRVHIGMDFFDASINRIAAWIIGARNVLRAMLAAMLLPHDAIRRMELDGDLTARLAWQQEMRAMPVGAVWDEHCRRSDVPVGVEWLERVRGYERDVLSKRPTGAAA